MITKTLKTGLFLIAIASFSFAGAQEKIEPKADQVEAKKHKSEKMFTHLDANADDVITIEEFLAKRSKDPAKDDQIKKRFESMDMDKNGTLDRIEFQGYFEAERKIKQVRKKETIKKKG